MRLPLAWRARSWATRSGASGPCVRLTVGRPQPPSRVRRAPRRNERVAPGTFEELESRVVIKTSSASVALPGGPSRCSDPGDSSWSRPPPTSCFLGVLETRGRRASWIEIDEGGIRLDSLEATRGPGGPGGWTGQLNLPSSEHSNPADRLAEDAGGLWSSWPVCGLGGLGSTPERRLLGSLRGPEPLEHWRHVPPGGDGPSGPVLSRLQPLIKLVFGVPAGPVSSR